MAKPFLTVSRSIFYSVTIYCEVKKLCFIRSRCSCPFGWPSFSMWNHDSKKCSCKKYRPV